MKHLFYVVMILSLLMAAVGCSNHVGVHHEHGEELSGTEEPPEITADGSAQAPDDVQEATGDKEPEPQGETGEGEMPPEVPSVEPPTEPPTEPPEVIPPVEPPTEPPIIEPPVSSLNNAVLIINELRTEGANTLNHTEFIEFKVLEAGTLRGIRVNIMYDAINPYVYVFHDIEVPLGEYIVLHFTKTDSGCIDELGTNLALSGGIEACNTARDLWVIGSDDYIKKTDIIFIEDEGGNVMDAIVLNEKPNKEWETPQAHFVEILEYLFYEGAWRAPNGSLPTSLDAFNTSDIGTSNYKSIGRTENKENTHSNKDWKINSFGTPGLPNK